MKNINWLYLSEVVEVVLPVDPAVGWTLVVAVGLVTDVTDVRSVTVVEHSFEQLCPSHTSRNLVNGVTPEELFKRRCTRSPLLTLHSVHFTVCHAVLIPPFCGRSNVAPQIEGRRFRRNIA
jgi:hypothetical protein